MGGSGGSGGISGRRESGTAESKKNFKALSDYMKTKYDVTITSDLDGKVPFEAIQSAAVELEKLYQEFGDIVAINTINGNATGDAYASATFHGALQFNPEKYKDMDSIRASAERDASSHWSPTGTQWQDIMVHEMGHGLTRAILLKIHGNGSAGSLSYYNRVMDWNKHQTCTRIVREAANKVKAQQRAAGLHPSPISDLVHEVSRYAGTNRTETVAECVMDYRRNGANAQPLSKEVWKIIKKELA